MWCVEIKKRISQASSWQFNTKTEQGQPLSIKSLQFIERLSCTNKWVLLAQPVPGQLIPLCGSLLRWEHCCSAIPSYFILGVVPSEPDPRPAAAEWVPCSVLVMGLIPDLMDHLEDKRISVSRTIQPCFVPSLTARRALMALISARHLQRGAGAASLQGSLWGPLLSPTQKRESAHSPDCCPIASLGPCREPSHLFPAGSWRLLARKIRDARASRDAGTRQYHRRCHGRCLPSSRTAAVGFGPPLSGMRTLLPALNTRPEQGTRWQQQTQEGHQMGFSAAGCAAGSLSCSRNSLPPGC